MRTISDEAPPKRRRRRKKTERIDRPSKPVRIIGVDGEGYDAPCGVCIPCMASDGTPKLEDCKAPRHLYIYLAAVDDRGELVADAYDPEGLSHDDCANMLLNLPNDALKFGYMFSYDVTKIVEELPAIDRYYLVRPQLRDELVCQNEECLKLGRGRKAAPPGSVTCPRCGKMKLRSRSKAIRFRGRDYNFFNGSLTIKHRPTKRKVKVWDCFRFFGCAFVEAIKDWLFKPDESSSDPNWKLKEILSDDGKPLCTKEQVERISSMKGKRGAFDEEDPAQIRAYCREECHLLALMMGRVKQAHEDAGIPLKRYEGAGSTATSLLTANEVSKYKGPRHRDLDADLGEAIASCFFGGRFEDSMVGIVHAPVFGFDISSAYPFALSGLPCLTCGSWRRLEKATVEELASARVALAEFHVREVSEKIRREIAWGPLPFRDRKGSISYGVNFYGWAWLPEILAALRGWPELVELTGKAWIYDVACEHAPFSFMPAGYRQRIAWGKEGAGKALKLGMNAAYGKCAQSLGEDPPFQSWVFAGMTTSTTRGQLLDAIATAKDRWNVLTVATDGIYALEDLPIKEPPRDTGTGDLKKPLGGWERKPIPEGVFVAKPGLYYKLGANLAEIRARGVGRREVHASMQRIMEGFLAWDRQPECCCAECVAGGRKDHYVALTSRRFFGAKHSIFVRSRCPACGVSWPGVPENGCPNIGCSSRGEVGVFDRTSLQEDEGGRPVYGLWGAREIRIAFDPYPKREREGIARDGSWARLRVRDLGGETSRPYDVGTHETTPEGALMRAAQEMQMEQPDWEEQPN